MRVRKAVITAAGKNQRALLMQTLFHQEGTERSVLSLIVREATRAGIGDVGDEKIDPAVLIAVGGIDAHPGAGHAEGIVGHIGEQSVVRKAAPPLD